MIERFAKNGKLIILALGYTVLGGCTGLSVAASVVGGAATGVKIEQLETHGATTGVKIEKLETRIEELERKDECSPSGC